MSVISALQKKFPGIRQPPKDDICYATTNRQMAVKQLGGDADLVLCIGSQNSSNSQRLKEIAREHGVPAYLIDSAQDYLGDNSRTFACLMTTFVLQSVHERMALPEMATDGQVAQAAVFMVSEYAGGITGQSLAVNAGDFMR